jgi:D-arabinose 1-dehydrogenase-like Zn-dependent alcohol dehydrogenase
MIQIGEAKVMVFGMGRIGTGAYDFICEHFGETVICFDSNTDQVERHQKAGRNVVVGDASDSDIWERMQPGEIRLVILTMSELIPAVIGIDCCGPIGAVQWT